MASDQPHGGGEMSIADMLRQAAEEVVQSHIPEGFRWCDEYNMYYSPTTGYFYDQKNNMYFHHSTQSYYYYDGGKDKLVCYQTVQQKPEWTCREYKRAAGRLFGKPALATMDQSAVDACEITYRLVDMVVSEENEVLGKRGKPDSRTRELRREKRKKAMEVYRKRREEKRMERERDRRRRSRSRSRDRSRDRLRKRSRSRSRERKRRSRSRERQSKKGREWDRGKEEYFHDGEWYRHDTGGSRDSRREQERMLLKKREEHERKRRGERQESCISSESDVSWEGDPEKEFFSHEYVDERTKMMQDEGYDQPPLLRLVEPAPLYTLHFITVDGARVGRGEGCDARIGCESADEEHFQVLFSHDNYAYYLLATSNNGVPVTVNGEPVKLNDYAALGHENTVTVGDYEMRVHIHYGMNSCAGCESGVLSTAAKEAARQNAFASARQQFKGESAHRKNLKEMKRAFGIAHHEDTGGGYNDRAGHRRKTMGSDSGVRLPQRKRANAADGIYAACSAKPLPGAVAITTATSSKAAAKKELSAENKGFKLLKGMGWKEGEGLGKNKAGRVAPVESEQKTTRAGLGAAPGTGLPMAATQKEAIMHMTRQRFSQIPDE